jgi:hypothetical protein
VSTNVKWKKQAGGIRADQAARTDERTPPLPAPKCVEHTHEEFQAQKNNSPGAEAPLKTVVIETEITLEFGPNFRPKFSTGYTTPGYPQRQDRSNVVSSLYAIVLLLTVLACQTGSQPGGWSQAAGIRILPALKARLTWAPLVPSARSKVPARRPSRPASRYDGIPE